MLSGDTGTMSMCRHWHEARCLVSRSIGWHRCHPPPADPQLDVLDEMARAATQTQPQVPLPWPLPRPHAQPPQAQMQPWPQSHVPQPQMQPCFLPQPHMQPWPLPQPHVQPQPPQHMCMSPQLFQQLHVPQQQVVLQQDPVIPPMPWQVALQPHQVQPWSQAFHLQPTAPGPQLQPKFRQGPLLVPREQAAAATAATPGRAPRSPKIGCIWSEWTCVERAGSDEWWWQSSITGDWQLWQRSGGKWVRPMRKRKRAHKPDRMKQEADAHRDDDSSG